MWLSGYGTRLLLRVGLKSPIPVGLKQPVAGKDVPRRAPTALGSYVVCSIGVDGDVVEPTNVGRLNGRCHAMTLTRRRISLLSSVRRRRSRGYPQGSPSRPPVFYVQRQMLSIWYPTTQCELKQKYCFNLHCVVLLSNKVQV